MFQQSHRKFFLVHKTKIIEKKTKAVKNFFLFANWWRLAHHKKSLAFKETLERRTGIPVVMWDERLTTVEANRTLMESGVRRENRKEYVDKLAAVYILQGYLDSEGMKNGKN